MVDSPWGQNKNGKRESKGGKAKDSRNHEKRLSICCFLAEVLLKHKIACVIANPRQVRDFIRGCGQIEKTIPLMQRTCRFSDKLSSKNRCPLVFGRPLGSVVHDREKGLVLFRGKIAVGLKRH